jgi:hypothetical protein
MIGFIRPTQPLYSSVLLIIALADAPIAAILMLGEVGSKEVLMFHQVDIFFSN